MAETVSGATAEKIRQMLLSGVYQRGDKLPSEAKLCEELGASRTSVREALRMLASAGYVEIIPNRGAFAAATSEEEIPSPALWLTLNREMVAELLSVRMCIEPFAAELCAKNISDEGIEAMRELLEEYAAVGPRDADQLARLDLAFHRAVLDGSKNSYLIRMYQPLLEGFMQYSRRSTAAAYTRAKTLAEHTAVLEAIAARSPAEARAAMQLHISIAMRRVRLREDND